MDSFLHPLMDLYESASLWSLIVLELSVFALCLHYVLPQKHRQARTVKLSAPPQLVWNTILDIQRYPSWRSHVVGVQSLDGLHFLEYVARTRQQLVQKHIGVVDNLSTTTTATGTTTTGQFKTRVRAIEMTKINDNTLIRVDRATRHNKYLSSITSASSVKLGPRSSFEREWEIYIRLSSTGQHTLLTLTETVRSEGYLARWLGPILGVHRVSQRFLTDLMHEVDRLQKQRVLQQQQNLCESPIALDKNDWKCGVAA
ncbi:hypothetical protein O0I10_007905 [Lichtheimia ornata]|uniref:Uncharacterized protein n=1 Tax=Lichtheimia ornata TaxID=688661 RepID=A0AAD7V141_9FUNG|nr:uncharacterized protein O0I10_007905 [Lichtheimia ornata]KAJ8656340.1 hypothetical protein O0I10_007905 [Lichtheimia ornata]